MDTNEGTYKLTYFSNVVRWEALDNIFETMENIKSENRKQDIYLTNSRYMNRNEGYIPLRDCYSKLSAVQ